MCPEKKKSHISGNQGQWKKRGGARLKSDEGKGSGQVFERIKLKKKIASAPNGLEAGSVSAVIGPSKREGPLVGASQPTVVLKKVSFPPPNQRLCRNPYQKNRTDETNIRLDPKGTPGGKGDGERE